MSSISFTAHGRCARATVCEPITTGSVGLSVSFAFDAAWSGLQKTAIFRGSGMAVDLVVSGDAATVPPEVLTIPGGDLRVGVWGADPDGNVIIPTVWATIGEIVPGAAPSGIDPQPPTPSWVAQVQEIAQDALDTANSVREDADAGAFDGATYTPAVSAGGDLSWTNDKGKPNPPTVNIKGPEGQPGQTGATPDISIGTVETLPPGSPATATITGTAENPVLSFGIPQGQQGAPGEVTQAEFDALADEVTQNTENIADLDGELTRQKSAIEDLQALTNRKAGMLVDTASGAIASFVPDSTVPNLLGVSVDIEPVQDLHGYDSPWPAGGGVNKFNDENATTLGLENADGTYSNTLTDRRTEFQFYVQLYNGNTLVRQVVGSGSIGRQAITATPPSACTKVRIKHSGSSVDLNIDYAMAVEENETITISINVLANNPSVVGGLVFDEVMIVNGGTAPTAYSPYSNLCPISGWDSVEVDATSINIWDEEWEVGDLSSVGGMPISASDRIRAKNYISVKPNTAYYLRCGTVNARVVEYDASKSMVKWNDGMHDAVFTTTANTHFIRFYMFPAYGATYNHDISINYPSTDTAYHPYAGNRYTIQLGQTVYGAKLTIAEDGSVTALIDRAELVVTDCSEAGIASTGIPYARKNIAVFAKAESTSNKNISSEYRYRVNAPSDSGWFRVVQTGIYIFDSRFTDLATANSILSSEKPQIVFELKTPIEIQLDPVTIATIANQTNNVWADAGDVTVEFAADLKHYIDSKIAAAVAALS